MVEFPRNPADVNFFKKKGEKSAIEIVNCTKKILRTKRVPGSYQCTVIGLS